MHQHISEFDRTRHAFSLISDTAYRTIHSPSCLYTLYLYQLTERFIFNHQSSPTCRRHLGVLLFLQQRSIRWQQNYLDQSFSEALQSLTGVTRVTKALKKEKSLLVINSASSISADDLRLTEIHILLHKWETKRSKTLKKKEVDLTKTEDIITRLQQWVITCWTLLEAHHEGKSSTNASLQGCF